MKLLMSQLMTHYTWQTAFDHVQEKGPQKIVSLFKLGLKEMPRLERTFASPIVQEHKAARDEVLALFSRIDQEMNREIAESNLTPEEFSQAVKKATNFTQEEWGQLARVPELIGKHHTELFAQRAFNTPRKRSPYFKV